MSAARNESDPDVSSPAPGQLAGVRRSRLGPVLWVDCGDSPVQQGREVVVESDEGEWPAIVVVGRDQIVEVPNDLRLVGRVIRVVDDEDLGEAVPVAPASAEEVIRRFFPDL